MTYGHVQDDNGGDEADTETSDETTSDHDTETSRRRLKDTSNREDTATGDDGHAASDKVGAVASDDGTEESTAGENGSRQGLVARRQMESGDGGCVAGVRVLQAGVLANEVRHGQNTTHPAGIITKEDAAKGRKGADEIGPKGDGGFDPRGVGRASDHGNPASRHDCDVEDATEGVDDLRCWRLGRG